MNIDTRSNAGLIQAWMATSRPSFEEALSQVDDARARGQISREEYLEFLDEWWPAGTIDALVEDEL